jgi:hypothetical protein
MRELKVDPKLVADQQGHTLDVNINVYTQTSLESRIGEYAGVGFDQLTTNGLHWAAREFGRL